MAGKKQRTKSNCFPNLSFAECRRGVKGADCQQESSLGRRKSVGHRIALQNGYRIVTEWSKNRRRIDTGLPYRQPVLFGEEDIELLVSCYQFDVLDITCFFLVHNIQQFNMATIKDKPKHMHLCTTLPLL